MTLIVRCHGVMFRRLHPADDNELQSYVEAWSRPCMNGNPPHTFEVIEGGKQ